MIDELRGHLERLAQLSPDGVQFQNDVGFSGSTLGPGLRLIRSFPQWTREDVERAFSICTIHSGQLGIDRETFKGAFEAFKPELPDAIAKRQAIAREALTVAIDGSLTAEKPFGVEFTAWKQVNTKVGPKMVRSGEPTELFWQAYRADKERLKRDGFSVGKSYRDPSKWEVTQWGRDGASTVPKVETKPLVAVEPLKNPGGLLAYQPAAVAQLVCSLRNFGSAVDASDTGTGKTFCALAACRELGLSPFVVAPKAVLPSWKRAAAHLGVKLAGCVNYELIRTGNTPAGKWTGKGKDEVFTWANPIKCLVFDEVHRCKGTDTQNAYLVRAARDQGIPAIALSATLAHNPLEMRAIGHLIGLHNWKNFWYWSKRYGCYQNKWGGFDFNGDREVLRELHGKIFPSHGSRIRIADLGDAFPETQIAAEAYNLNGAAAEIDRIDDEMHREIAELEDRMAKDSESFRAAMLVAMLRARQRAELVKVPLFVELAQDAIEEGQSVAVFVCFKETLRAIRERLAAAKIQTGEISGDNSGDERQNAIDSFQRDETHCIVAMIQAGGVGVSLHDLNGNRARASFISPTWSAVELRQTLGRIHRAGGKTKSIQRIVFVADSVEEQVRSRVAEKLNRLDTLNDGDLTQA